MDKKQAEQLKEILRSEFLPLFVGLRDELKAVKKLQSDLLAKEPPDIQKTEVVNTPEPIKEVGISNLPEVQKVEVTNQPEPIKEVSIANIAPMFGAIHQSFKDGVKLLLDTLKNNWNDAKANVFDVRVQNIEKHPDTIKVSNFKDFKQDFPERIKISNSQPSEAVPVILTDRDRKNFYNAVQQLYFANDTNLARLEKAMREVEINIDQLDVNTDEIEAKLDTIIALLQSMGGSGVAKQFFGELSVAGSTESVIASYLVPVGKVFTISGLYCEGDDDGLFRLYLDSTKVWQGRNAWTERNVKAGMSLIAVAGVTIYLKVLNLRTITRNFSGMFYGDEL